MGSDSDWTVMSDAAAALAEFGIAHEVEIVSAHRTPDRMIEFGRTARDRGLKVVIAGAGGAAHLPGMLAAVTTLPWSVFPCRWAGSTASIPCSPLCRCRPVCLSPRCRSAARATPH